MISNGFHSILSSDLVLRLMPFFGAAGLGVLHMVA